MSRWLRDLRNDPLETSDPLETLQRIAHVCSNNDNPMIAEVMTDPLEINYTTSERLRHSPVYGDIDSDASTDPLRLDHSNLVSTSGTTKQTIMTKIQQDSRDINSVILMTDPLQIDDSSSQSRGGNKTGADSDMAEIVLSKKGGPKVIHKGFMYTLHKKQTENIRWRCVNRSSHCRGSLTTTIDYKMPQARMEHGHLPDFRAAKIARKRSLLVGKLPVLPEENVSFLFRKTVQGDKKEEKISKEVNETNSTISGPNDERTKILSLNFMQSGSQATSSGRTIRIAAQPIARSQITNLATLPVNQQQHQQQQQSHQTQQHQQQQPKTLVLKTIPLKVKQVAPTTIKMAPRQPNVSAPQTVPPQQPTEVCLRWNSYHSNMQNSFPSLLDSEQFVDVTLACEGRSLKCHKMILSTCSDYLANLLRENPCQHPIILMKDLKFWEVEALVKFMYRGEVNVAHDKLPQLLNAAEALQVKGLAGPSPSLQNPRPPLLVPQSKQTNTNSGTSSGRVTSETKDNVKGTIPTTTHASAAPPAATPLSSPKRRHKRQSSDPLQGRTFTKIRLQRPITPTSPNPTVKLEPLDIPLSPTEMFPENEDDGSSNASNFDNLVMALHEDEDPIGDDRGSNDGNISYSDIPGPPDDLNDNEDHMEFVPTDFLEQEQDIVEEADGEFSKSSNEDIEEEEEEEEEEEVVSVQVKKKLSDDRRKSSKTDSGVSGSRVTDKKTEKCTNSDKTL